MLKSEPLGVSGSGGELMTDHVICPNCAHNFHAVSQSARDRIAELEAAITMTLRYADGNGMKDWRVFRDLRKVMKST